MAIRDRSDTREAEESQVPSSSVRDRVSQLMAP